MERLSKSPRKTTTHSSILCRYSLFPTQHPRQSYRISGSHGSGFFCECSARGADSKAHGPNRGCQGVRCRVSGAAHFSRSVAAIIGEDSRRSGWQVCARHASTRSHVILPMSRVQYSGGSLIIMWPTNVHEIHSRIAHLFVPFETASPDKFVTVTNTAIPFSAGPYVGQNLTPDFAFGRATSNGPEYSIVLESALSQSRDKLNNVAEMHLTRPEVVCVIDLNFLTSAFSYPPPSPARLTSVTFSAFKAAATVSLQDGVNYEEYTWAPPIRGIEMIIWAKEQGQIKEATKETWDLTPTNEPQTLAKAHAEIITIIRRITRSVCSKSIFDRVYPNKGTFAIDWQGFVPNLELRMLLDAHRRWLHWAFPKSKSLAEESGVKILKRKVAELYAESDDESSSATAESSWAAKKGKTGDDPASDNST
ncbi:hypothetical protein B0H10DRAFT_2090392, partial [Mycena sp. CBHHK59/15]